MQPAWVNLPGNIAEQEEQGTDEGGESRIGNPVDEQTGPVWKEAMMAKVNEGSQCTSLWAKMT